MKKILSLLIFLVLFSAHLSYGKDLLLLGALMENDQMKEGVYIDIELTNKQPDPESYTLTGENFLIVKILNFTKDKLLYYNVFFNKSSFSLKNDPLGEIIELYQGIYVNNEIAILRAKAGHYIVITSVNEKNQTFVFSKNSAAAEEFMPFLKDAIIKSGIKDFWEIEDEQITESTKIEPYQSTAVRDIRNKNDLNFEVNGVKFTMIEVEGGTFTMGDNSNRVGEQYANNKPAHNVTLSSFYIAQTEVTQELWHAVMGKWPESYKGPKYPVNDVSWDDCQKFIKKLNSITGKKFRLPTEAEWEFAARGGNMSEGYKYAGSNTINDVSWYSTNSLYGTHEVATKKPNELGIYDMSGNSIEWCQDWYDYNYYKSSPSINPIGPKSGKKRVLRGGGWKQDDRATCLSRYFDSPKRDVFNGFRLAIGKDN